MDRCILMPGLIDRSVEGERDASGRLDSLWWLLAEHPVARIIRQIPDAISLVDRLPNHFLARTLSDGGPDVAERLSLVITIRILVSVASRPRQGNIESCRIPFFGNGNGPTISDVVAKRDIVVLGAMPAP